MQSWQIALLIVGVIITWCGFWVALLSMLGRLGGWRKLALAYPYEKDSVMAVDESDRAEYSPFHLPQTRSTAAQASNAATQPRRTFKMRSMVLRGWCSYNGGVNFTALDHGLRISVVVIFRFGHPDILIPWRDLSATEVRRMGMPMVRLTTDRVPEIPITVSAKLSKSLAMAVPGRWPEAQPS